jgi:glycosyltransferase involved in cell wall biosynthesis
MALDVPPRRLARERLGLPESGVLFTFFGSIHAQKNVHTVVQAFARAARSMPEAMLLVAGKPWDSRWYNRLYAQGVDLRARLSHASARMHLRFGFVPEELVSSIYGATDVVLLPHAQVYGSASGVFHQAIGAGCAVLCARGPKFEDGARLLADLPELLVPPMDVSAWARSMQRIGTDERLRRAGRDAVQTYARETSWPAVARRHLEIYDRLAPHARDLPNATAER